MWMSVGATVAYIVSTHSNRDRDEGFAFGLRLSRSTGSSAMNTRPREQRPLGLGGSVLVTVDHRRLKGGFGT